MTAEEPERRDEPAGAPRSWDPAAHYVQVSRDAVKRLGLVDAYVFALLLFKTRNSGGWAATIADVATETGLPAPTARKALDRLRSGGYVTGKRADDLHATLTWRIVWLDDARSSRDDLLGQGSDLLGHGVRPSRSSLPSVETERSSTTAAPVGADEVEHVIAHHRDLVARWDDKAPRADKRTRLVAERLIATHGFDMVLNAITWAQGDDFWKVSTRRLSNEGRRALVVDPRASASAARQRAASPADER